MQTPITSPKEFLWPSERQEFDAPTCPNCGGKNLSPFYQVMGIPVHSCLLMPTRHEALTFPTGNLVLGFCAACGFVTNLLYEAKFQRYSTLYEETQGFSPRFNQFQESLALRLIEKYGLRDKQVLEIGCGKGEFLVRLCELGGNRGIGIDPSYVPERTAPEAARRIQFIQDYYSPRYEHLQADVICCRHTLEHIAPTQEFLRSVRRSIGKRTDTLLFFEVPDVLRVLREGAFWDIYYEHCSYFTQGSLERLFLSCGFRLEESYLDYDGQYLLLTARPSPEQPPQKPMTDDFAATAEAVAKFPEICSRTIQDWRQRVQGIVSQGRRVVVWGSGSKGVSFLTTVKLGEEIPYVVDINPYRQGKFMPGTGQEIVSPEKLKSYRPDSIIVMNPVYCQEIAGTLKQLGIQAELLPA